MIILNSFILSIISLVYYIPKLNLPQPINGMNLFFPTFGHNRIAELLVYTLPFLIFEYHLSPVYKNKPKILLVLFVSMFIISLGRGSMMIFVLCLFAFSLFSYRDFLVNNIIKKVIFATGSLIISFLIIIFVYSNIYIQKDDSKIIKNLYRPVKNEYRMDYFQEAFIGFWKSPVVGNGLDTFTYISKIYSPRFSSWSDYAHNHFLQLFSDTGFFGGLIFLILIIALFIKPYQNFFRHSLTKLEIGLLLALTSSALHSLIDFDWQINTLFIIFFIGLAILNNQFNDKPFIKIRFDNRFINREIFIYFILLIIFGKLLESFQKFTFQELKSFSLHGQNNKIVKYLNLYERYDKLNSIIPDWHATIYYKEKNYSKAHLYNKKTIAISGFYGESIVKRDFLLYLSQAKELLNKQDTNGAIQMLSKANNDYPYYLQKLNKSEELFRIKDLQSIENQRQTRGKLYLLIEYIISNINGIFLKEEELLDIISKIS
jgi:hypothetical protein